MKSLGWKWLWLFITLILKDLRPILLTSNLQNKFSILVSSLLNFGYLISLNNSFSFGFDFSLLKLINFLALIVCHRISLIRNCNCIRLSCSAYSWSCIYRISYQRELRFMITYNTRYHSSVVNPNFQF